MNFEIFYIYYKIAKRSLQTLKIIINIYKFFMRQCKFPILYHYIKCRETLLFMFLFILINRKTLRKSCLVQNRYCFVKFGIWNWIFQKEIALLHISVFHKYCWTLYDVYMRWKNKNNLFTVRRGFVLRYNLIWNYHDERVNVSFHCIQKGYPSFI